MPDAPVAAPPGETIAVTERVVACDGGGGVLGHPRVYLRIVHNEVVCPYCSRRFVLTGEGDHDHGH
jgi:uncharacterized Zn-finger protein